MPYKYFEFPWGFLLLSHLPGKILTLGEPKHLLSLNLHLSTWALPPCAVWQSYLKPKIGLLPLSPSDHFMTCSIPQSSYSFLRFSQLVFSWWPHLLWEKEAIRWEHLCLPIIVSTALPVSASIPSLSSHARPVSVVSVPSPPLSLSYCLPLFWTLRASSNSSLDPIIFSNCSISLLLIIVKLLKRAISCFCISTKNVL